MYLFKLCSKSICVVLKVKTLDFYKKSLLKIYSFLLKLNIVFISYLSLKLFTDATAIP